MMDTPAGLVFDLKEFALYDGPGLRTTVFLKGCPLRCSWCHNPEGLDPWPETMKTANGERPVGRVYGAKELAEKLLGYLPVFEAAGGGVTFSGGEPLLQADFVRAVMGLLRGRVHIVLQTSGYAAREDFLATAALADLVFFDIKIMRPDAHRRHTGRDNGIILDNLTALDEDGPPYRIRLPLIPGITDTEENYALLGEFIHTRLVSGKLAGLDLLPYNQSAGGKYQAVGRRFEPGIEPGRRENIRPELFRDFIREVTIL